MNTSKDLLQEFRLWGAAAEFTASHTLVNLPPLERIQTIGALITLGAQLDADGATLELAKRLKTAYEVAAEEIAHPELGSRKSLKDWEKERMAREIAEVKLKEHLMLLYRGIPQSAEETVLNTKLWIIEQIVLCWWKEELWPESISAFEFICEAYGKAVSKKLRDGIQQIIRDRIGGRFKPEYLEQWLEQPHVPENIQQLLVIARARNGGVQFTKRDIRNAKFLKSFQLEECSEAALALLQDFMERVALLDFKIKVLLDEMKKGWLHKEQIGESEYVDGKISAVFVSNLLYIHLDVVLPKDCPEPLGRDIYGRAYRHVKKWFDQGHGPKGGTVSLAVHGGKDALKLSVTILG